MPLGDSSRTARNFSNLCHYRIGRPPRRHRRCNLLGKRLIVTVHGISTPGEWQERVSRVLGPHFEFKSIKYSHYRRLGAPKLVLEPWVIAAIPLEWWVSHTLRWLTGWWAQSLIIALLILLAFVLAPYRRRRALVSVARQLDSVYRTPGEKYLIAHSLGTLLAAQVMQKFPNLRFHSVILTGCVLARRFDWTAIQHRGQALHRVLNEVGGKDWVSRLAFTLEGLIPSMGHAGRFGFEGDSSLVHSVAGPLEICELCHPPRYALVHNVVSEEMRHSDHFITSSYAREFWLPFFWNLPPGEFKDFLEICEKCSTAQKQGRYADLKDLEKQLHSRTWLWPNAGELTLPDFMHREIDARLEREDLPKPSDEILQALIKLGVQKAWNISADAQRGIGQPQLLHPALAMTAAVSQVLHGAGLFRTAI